MYTGTQKFNKKYTHNENIIFSKLPLTSCTASTCCTKAKSTWQPPLSYHLTYSGSYE